jgi:hypothetical protein
MKNDPVIVLVSKPRDVDNLLERGMSVWVVLGPTRVRFLRDTQ